MPGSVDFLYDYASPYSYLADAVLSKRLPGINVRHRPMYLRGLAPFASGPPLCAAKAQYLMLDLQRCCDDEGIPIAMPPEFPINGLYALRCALVCLEKGGFDALHRAMFNAAWRDRRPVSSKSAVLAIAAEAGLNTDDLGVAMDAPDIKARLRADTEAAEQRGVFGAPTFFVGDDMFWGHDRMAQALRAALGRDAA